MSDILIKSELDPLYGMNAAEVLKKLKRKLTGKVEKAYYFGSFNTPAFNRKSDIDLILINNTKTAFVERPIEYLEIMDIVPNIDILVYTQTEFDKLTRNPSPGFWKNVVKSLVQFI